jgi:hypothetical protein
MPDLTDEVARLRKQVDRLSQPSPIFTTAPVAPPELSQFTREMLAVQDEGKQRRVEQAQRQRERQAALEVKLAPKRAKRAAEIHDVEEQIIALQLQVRQMQERLRELHARPLR